MNLWELAKKAFKYVLDSIYRGWKDKKAEQQLEVHKDCNNGHKEVHVDVDNGIHIEVIEDKEK